MEDAAEALKLAAAVLALVIALSVSMRLFSQARETSDIVIQRADVTSSQEYETASNTSNGNRIVGLETIIPTLYKYYKENYRVVFLKGAKTDGTINSPDPLTIYQTTTKKENWSKSYIGYLTKGIDGYIAPSYSYNISPGTDIFVFDLAEEAARGEPWVGDTDAIKNNITLILNGKAPYLENNQLTIKTAQYVELLSRETTTSGKKTTKKSTITYVLINQ